ncbi:MAG: redoxin domain-containing protein [Acidobacteria bacterium]|nr:redoxin domain-containing protein [Acidobacteriota bacterium]
MTWIISLLLAAVFIQGPATSPSRIDVSKLGPQVGQRVPDFNLKDQNGKSWTLQSIMGSKGAMLVFVRSADW